jgi:ATP-binding cassette, subfamily B (MDR/TAP), member 1
MSQIFDDDFVYLLKEGIIIEEGFRADLMKRTGGEFAKMAREQSEIPLPETELEDWGRGEELLEAIASAEPEPKLFGFSLHVPGTRLRMSRRPTSITYFDILARYTNASDQDVSIPPSSSSYLNSAFNSSQPELHPLLTRLSSRRRSLSMSAPLARFTNRPRPESFLPLSTFAAPILSQPTLTISTPYDDNEEMLDNEQARGVELDLTNPFGELSAVGDRPCLVENVFMNTNESADLEKQGAMAMHGRTGLLYPGLRARWDTGNGLKDGGGMVSIDISDSAMDKTTMAAAAMAANSSSILRVMVSWFPTVPHKRIFVVGILTSLGHGVITPVWSKYLAELMGLVAAGGTDQSALLRSSAIALVLSIADGLCVGTSFIALEIVAYHWVTNLRQESFRLVLAQDKAWHDQSENSPATIVQSLIKDGDDMIPLVSTIPGHFLTAVTMIAVGIIWALIVGWKLTLVGVAILPVFGGAIGAQFMLLNKIELRNKRMREEVARIFYEVRR